MTPSALSTETVNVSLSKTFIERLLLRRTHSQGLAQAILSSSNNLGAVIQAIIEAADDFSMAVPNNATANSNYNANLNAESRLDKLPVQRKSEMKPFSFNPQTCAYTFNI